MLPHPRPSLGGSKGRSAAKDGGKRLFCLAMQSGSGRHEKPVALATDLKGLPRPRRKIAAFPSLRLRRSRRSRPSAQFSHSRGPGGRVFRTAFWRRPGGYDLVRRRDRRPSAREMGPIASRRHGGRDGLMARSFSGGCSVPVGMVGMVGVPPDRWAMGELTKPARPAVSGRDWGWSGAQPIGAVGFCASSAASTGAGSFFGATDFGRVSPQIRRWLFRRGAHGPVRLVECLWWGPGRGSDWGFDVFRGCKL